VEKKGALVNLMAGARAGAARYLKFTHVQDPGPTSDGRVDPSRRMACQWGLSKRESDKARLKTLALPLFEGVDPGQRQCHGQWHDAANVADLITSMPATIGDWYW
jgi:hypothetical protein